MHFGSVHFISTKNAYYTQTACQLLQIVALVIISFGLSRNTATFLQPVLYFEHWLG